jgi:DNA-binding PucR family transcriptional regulator
MSQTASQPDERPLEELTQLFRGLRTAPALQRFVQQQLGPLEAYERQHGRDLLPTVEAFFECGGDLSHASARLRVHRNAVLYRLRRVEEVAGLRLDDPRTWLPLQVALQARRALV